jgi:hypothetical protein
MPGSSHKRKNIYLFFVLQLQFSSNAVIVCSVGEH